MRTEEFKEWLANRGIADADAIIRYCTNGEKVYCAADIDAQFRKKEVTGKAHGVCDAASRSGGAGGMRRCISGF